LETQLTEATKEISGFLKAIKSAITEIFEQQLKGKDSLIQNLPKGNTMTIQNLEKKLKEMKSVSDQNPEGVAKIAEQTLMTLSNMKTNANKRLDKTREKLKEEALISNDFNKAIKKVIQMIKSFEALLEAGKKMRVKFQ
jgi:hypothetical protein